MHGQEARKCSNVFRRSDCEIEKIVRRRTGYFTSIQERRSLKFFNKVLIFNKIFF